MIHQTYIAFLLSLFFVAAPCPASHPFHICIGEMDWDEQRECWEVALRLHAEDLQREMVRSGGKAVELQPGELPPELGKVLETHFYIAESLADPKPEKGSSDRSVEDDARPAVAPGDSASNRSQESRVSRLELVGTEASRGWFWVYFRLYESKVEPLEGSSDAKAERVRFLYHTILLDQVEDQSNTLLVRLGKQRKSLTFQADSKRSAWPVFDQASK
jgi:hypothetical protein